jgi:hypothetical protein
MKLFLVCLLTLFFTGCASMPDAIEHGSIVQTVAKDGTRTTENRSDYSQYVATKAQLAAAPLFKLTCPASGCMIASLEVANPHAARDIAAPAPPPKIESAAVGVMREFKEALLGLAPIGMAATVGHTTAKIFSAFGGSVESIAGKIQAPQASVTTTTSNATTNTNSGNTSTTSNTNSGNTISTTTTTTNPQTTPTPVTVKPI